MVLINKLFSLTGGFCLVSINKLLSFAGGFCLVSTNKLLSFTGGFCLVSPNKLLSFAGGFCGAVHGVDHGFVENTTSVLTKGSVTYKCFQGFTFKDTAKMTCTDDRTWDSRPTCSGEYNVKMYKAQVMHF